MLSRFSFLRAVPLALPILFTLACGDDDSSPSTPTFLVQGADMGAQVQNVTVSNGGNPVSGATVTVNGEAATPGAAGEYSVTLAAPVAAGGALNLEVQASGETITATGNVPEAPVLTAPGDGATFLAGDPILVTWTSATDPDRFVLVAVGATTKTFSIAGTNRGAEWATGELAAGEWELRVYAYNDGIFTGSIESESAMNIRGEAAAYPSVTVIAPVLVQGTDMSGFSSNISIRQGGPMVDGATVTVNGEAALQSAPGENYFVDLAAPVAVGGLLTLDISFPSVVIQGTGTVPEAPVITAPAEGANIAVANAIDITWTSTADPDRFQIFVQTGAGVQVFDAAGTARAFTIPANTLPVGGPYPMDVFAYNDGTFTGPVDPTSRMNIRGEDRVNITILP